MISIDKLLKKARRNLLIGTAGLVLGLYSTGYGFNEMNKIIGRPSYDSVDLYVDKNAAKDGLFYLDGGIALSILSVIPLVMSKYQRNKANLSAMRRR